jgi:hypothetical protein
LTIGREGKIPRVDADHSHAERPGTHCDVEAGAAHADHDRSLVFQHPHALIICVPPLLRLIRHEPRQLARQHQKHRQSVVRQLGTFDDAVVREHDGAVPHQGISGQEQLPFHPRAERLHPSEFLGGFQVGRAERSADEGVRIHNLLRQLLARCRYQLHLRRNLAAGLQFFHDRRAFDHNFQRLRAR